MRFRHCSAFTLVEVLLAAGITALLAAFMLVVAGQIMSAWTQNAGQLTAETQARLVLDQLESDLQTALYRDDGAVWLAATVLDTPDNSDLWQPASLQKPAAAGGSLRLDAPALADARFGQAGVWLRFFITAQGANDDSAGQATGTESAPVAVSYQLIRHRSGSNPDGDNQEYLLYRVTVRPAESDSRPGTLEAGFDLDPRGPPAIIWRRDRPTTAPSWAILLG